ncbi:class I SAM-dependent methyltransferase [Algoriphagus formosus]|uniref:Class I SAM-dependent methyltransferase n=1 Tax=Algoriphagus formosus TaxID=2007308 RepID=A0A4R5UYB7_9BACT|nr:class I SAM-dependent methyltransferase [Algoriphagus aquimaris]TDK44211.1 class I SAM-dependent methyltransferase [Algoriphagus aquimaris]
MNLTFGDAQIYTSERMMKFPKLSKAFFKVFGYTNLGNYARFTIFKKLLNQVPIPRDGKILDLGTGYGEYAFSLSKAFPSGLIHALDIDPERIYTLRQAIRKSLVSNILTYSEHLGNVYLPELDFVFSIDVFEHIEEENMPFKEVYDRLKPGGHFLVKIPNKQQRTILPEAWFEEHQEWLEDEHVGQVYDLEGLKNRFEMEGFEVIHASYSDGWLSRMGWELAYLGKKVGFIGQLASLPLAKGMVLLDRVFHRNTWGNAIQVIGKKPKL